MLMIKNGRTGTVWVLPAMVVVGMMMLSACGTQSTPAASTDATSVPATSAPVATAAPAETATDAPISFKKDVLPILQSRCSKCHGGEKTEKKFDVSSYKSLMAGSEKGPAIVAGDAAASKLLQLVEQGKMPKRSAKLLPAQIQILIDWINQGALNN